MKYINWSEDRIIVNKPYLTGKMISVVVPTYRDAEFINEMVSRLETVLSKITPKYEIIYVNDQSPDNSAEILNVIARQNKRVTVIHHSRNYGLMGVFTTGMRHAVGDAVVIMDGDLQDPPEVIEQFVAEWVKGPLVVYGFRYKREETLLRRAGYFVFYRLWNKIANISIPKDAGDFSLMDRKVVDIINSLPEKDRFIRGLRAWVGFPQVGVPYFRPKRAVGLSTQSLYNYFSWSSVAITSFSFFPLRVVTITTVGFSFVLFIYFLVNLVLYFMGIKGPKGFMTLISLNLLTTTLILICLSIIAEYLIRIYIETKQRPASVVGEILNDHRKDING